MSPGAPTALEKAIADGLVAVVEAVDDAIAKPTEAELVDAVMAVKAAVDAVVALLPAKPGTLDAATVAEDKAIVDAAEAAKFGPAT